MSDEERDLSQPVDGNSADAGQASYNDDYIEIPMMGGNETGRNVNRSAIIREFPLDGLSTSNLTGDLSEMRCYLRGRLRL